MVLARVVILIEPDAMTLGRGKLNVPLRTLLSFDDALQMAHALIAASARLHRATAD